MSIFLGLCEDVQKVLFAVIANPEGVKQSRLYNVKVDC
jgi:hypothetical protein